MLIEYAETVFSRCCGGFHGSGTIVPEFLYWVMIFIEDDGQEVVRAYEEFCRSDHGS